MKTTLRLALVVVLLLTVAAAQRRRDPLTSIEADQVRDAADEPLRRLPLFVKFTQMRMEALDQLRANPKAGADRGQQIHDLLEDVTTLIDELNDNIDDYDARARDLRKPLKQVITVATEFQAKLKGLKGATATDPRAARESKDYAFALENAIDAANSLLDNAQKTLADQIANKGELKK